MGERGGGVYVQGMREAEVGYPTDFLIIFSVGLKWAIS